MQAIFELWMPIVLSAVIVFIASAILWMATPLHKNDHQGVTNEPTLRDTLRAQGLSPGQYCIPWCPGANMKDPEYASKLKDGPWASIIIPSGPPNFGRSLGLWFVHQFILAALVAYITSAALPFHAGTPYLKVFQVAGAAALAAQAGCWAEWTIWKGVPWRISFIKLFDGLIYALLTAGIFGWLWPREVLGA